LRFLLSRRRWTLTYGAVNTLSSMTKQKRQRKAAAQARGGSQRRTKRKPRRIHYKVALTCELQPGQSRKFLVPIRGADEECFLINYEGQFHAYVNRCRHVPMAMDWVDNQFFTEQGRYLMCQTHNAYYEPDSGECIAGPPGTCGKFLYRVPLEVVDGVIYATPPEEKFEERGSN
jgi:nitrite reductase/ring-hydroxylating ferredoxin subunit